MKHLKSAIYNSIKHEIGMVKYDKYYISAH